MDPFYSFNGIDYDYAPSPYSTTSVTSDPYDMSAMKDMDLGPLDLSPPLDPPSRDDWERFKSTILDQYLGNKMAVKGLVQHMDLYYQFKATPRMFKQRFTEWGVFKYPKAAAKRIQKSGSFTSAPAPQMSTSPALPDSTAMSRVSSEASRASNGSMFSTPFVDDMAPSYEPQFNDWGCLQNGICPQSAVCAHRHCIQTVLSNLQTQHHHNRPTSHPNSSAYPSPYNQSIVPRRESVEKVVYYVEQFTESFSSPGTLNSTQHIPDAAAQAARITSGLVGHCSHKSTPQQCERCTWAEFDFGLAMLEDGYTELAVGSFELGCRLVHLLLSSPSKLFIRNLVMAFGSARWEQFEDFRHKLLEYLALMAQVVLGDHHPVTIILQTVSHGDSLVASAEHALRKMITTFETNTRAADPDVLLVKRSLSVILRRQEEFAASETLLLTAIADSENENGYSHKETRRCLRRLGHLYMQQQRWDEAEATFMRILETAPGRQGAQSGIADSLWIPDEISVYTYQHLARLSSDRGDLSKCRFYFSQELMAAIKRWGPGGEYTAECLSLVYNATPGDNLAYIVQQYPEVFEEYFGSGQQRGVIISKARWCAVRNLL